MTLSTVLLVRAVTLAALHASSQTQPLEINPDNLVRQSEPLPAATTQPKPVDTALSPEAITPALLSGPLAAQATQPATTDLLQGFLWHIPDPQDADRIIEAEIKRSPGKHRQSSMEHIRRLIAQIDRPTNLRLSLQDALRRTLAGNFAIRVSSYNPAIAAARVVEAEAAFDAAYYINLQNNKVNQPTASALVGSDIRSFDLESGIRKLLPSGMQVQTAYHIERLSNNFQFQQLNPQWVNDFSVQFNQPLLRGFGVDFNRSQIRLENIGRRQSLYQFKRDVRNTLRDAEEAYWRLVQARRQLVVSARLLATFQEIYASIEQRMDYDVFRIQLADTRARLEASRADFVRVVANVRNAEDRLIATMNDPTVDLADDTEIIPIDFPPYLAVVLDRIAEVQTALEQREELTEAKLAIKTAQVQIGVAKNQALPQLDLTFRYAVDGLGPSQHDAFSEVTKNDFHEYFVGINFELPVGNRARRAALAQAKLRHGQAIAALKQQFDQVIFEVNIAIREVQVNHDQIEPSLQSAIANEDQVNSLEARMERRDYLTLNSQLNAHQTLAQARNAVLSNLVDYSIAIINLERTKGTLLTYNGVQLDIPDQPLD